MSNYELLEYFASDYVYSLKMGGDHVFLCSTSASNTMGRLTRYNKVGCTEKEIIYEKTGISYFLNYYPEDDIKALFVDRDNYDIIGKLQDNFELKDNKKYLVRKNNGHIKRV